MRILQIQTLESKKEQKFIEYDDLLKHAMFQIFCDFIENDNGFQANYISEEEEKELTEGMINSLLIYNQRCEKAQQIYKYWKQRQEEWARIDSEKDPEKYYDLFYDSKDKELQMMRDIVELSPGMWT